MVPRVPGGAGGEPAEERGREAVAAPGAHAGHRGVVVRREGPRSRIGRVGVGAADAAPGRVLPRQEPSGVPVATTAAAAADGRWGAAEEEEEEDGRGWSIDGEFGHLATSPPSNCYYYFSPWHPCC